MPRKILISDEASREIVAAYDWYEAQEPGLGDRFLSALKSSFASISLQPDINPLRFTRFRRIRMRKFPYAIYYEHDDLLVSVQSVFHEAQHPSRLNRLRKIDP